MHINNCDEYHIRLDKISNLIFSVITKKPPGLSVTYAIPIDTLALRGCYPIQAHVSSIIYYDGFIIELIDFQTWFLIFQSFSLFTSAYYHYSWMNWRTNCISFPPNDLMMMKMSRLNWTQEILRRKGTKNNYAQCSEIAE